MFSPPCRMKISKEKLTIKSMRISTSNNNNSFNKKDTYCRTMKLQIQRKKSVVWTKIVRGKYSES